MAVISNAAYSQIKYVDLNISQPNVEDCITNVETNIYQEDFKVFPNPTKGLFTIQVENSDFSSKLKVVIYNINGQVIYQKKLDNKPEYQINLSAYPKGTYFLNISAKKKFYKAEIILK